MTNQIGTDSPIVASSNGGGASVVAIDAGHGGSVKIGGSSANNATGPNGLLEKNLTLDVAMRTAALLAPHSRVILTRTADVNMSLEDRAAVARKNSADFFLSIHFNGFHDPSVDGTEVWIARTASAVSAEFAQAILARLVAVTRVANRGVRQADLGVLLPSRHAPHTAACLAEIAFLSNPDQARRLEDDGYKQQLAQALATAVLERLRVPVFAGAIGSAPAPASAHSLGVATFLADRLVDYFRNEMSQRVPLDPGIGGQCIGEGALEIGDIIVSTTDHLSSRGIRFGSGSQVSHAGLYIGGGQVVEAVGQGVILRSLTDSLADDSVAVAFRYPGITEEQQLMVRDYAGQQLDKPYNYVGIVRQATFQVESSNCDALPGELQQTCRAWIGKVLLGSGNTDTFFCSQLVLAAFASAGIPLTTDPPVWGTPQDIVELSLSAHLAYVGHLKTSPVSTQSLSEPQTSGFAGVLPASETLNRRLAAGIGGHGAQPPRPATASLDTVTLGFGVPGGVITDGFYRDRTEKLSVTGRTAGRGKHLGIDASTSNAHGGGADDPRRGLPVYAAIKPTIDIADLNAVRVARNDQSLTGLGIDGQGSARLQNAVVLAQPWGTREDSAYGGVVGLACRYSYPKTDGSTGTFTLYIEFLHLITPTYPPKDGQGKVISAETWAATGKAGGFGPSIQNHAVLTAEQLTGGDPILVGHLGATQFPHVHIQAAYGSGEQGYLREFRFDPSVMLQPNAATTQALAFGVPSLTLNDVSFTYDVPGTVSPIIQPNDCACWATAATMLIAWRDQSSYPIEAVCDMAGPQFRTLLNCKKCIERTDKEAFLQRLDLREEPPANYSVQGYLDMLRAYGPLWVTTDVVAGLHARIMTGMYGDGSPDNTYVYLIDPADGQRHQETFQHFVDNFEQVARDAAPDEPLFIQVVHNPGR